MRSLLFSFVVLLAATATAGLIGEKEHAVAPIRYSPPPNQQFPVAVASDGSGFVTAWTGWGGFYASYVSPAGTTAHDSQVRLAAEYASDVSICWSGHAYIVTWIENSVLRMATLNREGGLLTPPRQLAAPAFTSAGTLISNGRTVLLLFVTGSGMVVHGMLLDPEGAVILPNIAMPIAQFDGAGGRLILPLRLATDGNRFAVFWESVDYANQRTAFYAARIDTDGVVMDPAMTIGRSGLTDYGFAVVGARGRYVVASLDRAAKGMRRFVINAETTAVTSLPVIDDARFGAQLTADDKDFVLYGLQPSGLYTARFSGDSELVPPQYQKSLDLLSERSTSTPLLWNGSRFILTWSERGDVVGTFLDGGLSGPAPFGIGFSPRQQVTPVVARSPEESLIVWFEQDSDTQGSIRGARVDAGGVLLDLEPMTIATGARFSAPAAVFTGAGYYVSWIASDGKVRGRLVQGDGTMAALSQDLGAGRSVALAASASMIVAVFDDGNINAVRLTALGEKIDVTPIVIASARGYLPRVATNGTEFLVVWTEGPNPIFLPPLSPNGREVYGARLHAEGSSDQTPIAIGTGPGEQQWPEVASDGRDFLVAFEWNGTIVAKRVLAEGQIAGGTAEQPGALIGIGVGPPKVAPIVNGFYVGWEIPVGSRRDLMVAPVDRDGKPTGEPLVVASSAPAVGYAPLMNPALATATGRSLIVAYDQVFEDERGPTVTRVFYRLVRGEMRRRTVRP